MARSCRHQPAVPPPAERARAVAVRARHAALIAGVGPGAAARDEAGGADAELRVVPTLHHVPATGAATLQLPEDHPLVLAVRERGAAQLPVMLELADTAPVDLRQPVRALLWISGRLRVLPTRVARRAALRIAGERPDERLLDVGHGACLLRLEPCTVVLSDAEGTEVLAPTAVATAPADPLAGVGDEWLAHLADAHASVLADLGRCLPADVCRAGSRVAPLAVDRLGLRLRVEDPLGGDHDVRLGFPGQVVCPRRLGEAVRHLADQALTAPVGPPAPHRHGHRATDA